MVHERGIFLAGIQYVQMQVTLTLTIVVLWYHRIVVLWYRGIVVSWYRGIVVTPGPRHPLFCARLGGVQTSGRAFSGFVV